MGRQGGLQRRSRYAALSKGVKKRWLAGGPVSVNGKEYSPQEILDELQALLDSHTKTVQAHGAWRAQVAKQRALEKSRHAFVNALEVAARLRHGEKLDVLADFGLDAMKKPGPKSVHVKAEAAEKGKATRKRRGTMGPRQKKKLKSGT
ncbi:MAG TPA: hypothetical protein VGL81_20615 [Polyangiaceae bacterium]|jgi:hypothetical protein